MWLFLTPARFLPCAIRLSLRELIVDVFSQGFKSAEEMEEEEREAQSAKLQELIRRGTPQDLQQANHLMKIMAGYDQSSKTDYRAKAAEEIGKLKSKAALLEEMLGKVKQGESIGRHDTFEVYCDHYRKPRKELTCYVGACECAGHGSTKNPKDGGGRE